MLELHDVDLRTDPQASRYLKHELVDVSFADTPGELVSREGPNRYRAGDAIVTGSTGDRWCVSRERFDTKYEPVAPLTHGHAGRYRNKPVPVMAKQMREPFSVARCAGGDVLHGEARDWLMQYAPGDFGITANERFQQVYRKVET